MAVYNKENNSKLRELQLCELDLIKAFVAICEKHNLRYYLIGGTMLGAVRHQGFIPWDDDVDIGMPRPDYEQFLRVAPEEIPHYMQVLNYKTTPDYLRYFSRLVDTRVKIYNDSNTETLIENAWIDIFPLDGLPKNALLRKLRFVRLSAQRVMYHFSCFEQMVNLMRPGRPLYQRILIKIGQKTKIGRRKDTKTILNKLDANLKKHAYDSSTYVMNFFGAYVFKEMIPKDWLGTKGRYPFEDLMLSGAEAFDIYLRNFYGDYMTPPSDAHKDKHTITKIEYGNDSNK